MIREYNVDMYRSHSIRIDKQAEYDISDLVKMGAFWWIKNRIMYLEIVKQDAKMDNLLQVETTGEGKGTRYKIKGSNIIKFYKVYGPGINLLKGR